MEFLVPLVLMLFGGILVGRQVMKTAGIALKVVIGVGLVYGGFTQLVNQIS